MMWDGWHWGWGFFWMWIFWLLVLVVVVAVLWRALAGTGSARVWVDPAEQELRMRYARGEIDAEEYERRLADLRRLAERPK